MKYYLCPNCYKIYDGDLIKYPYCPDLECNSCDMELIELDELMIIPIRKLNELGYITKFCCSGHFYSFPLSTYILFDEEFQPDGCPKNWEVVGNSIRYNPMEYNEWAEMTDIQREKLIFQGMQYLYEWCDQLSPCDFYY